MKQQTVGNLNSDHMFFSMSQHNDYYYIRQAKKKIEKEKKLKVTIYLKKCLVPKSYLKDTSQSEFVYFDARHLSRYMGTLTYLSVPKFKLIITWL